jgi:hypothetical protein
LSLSKNMVLFFFETQRFGDWVLSPFQVKHAQLGSTDRANRYFRTAVPAPRWQDGDRIQSPKRCILKNKQDGVFR